MKKMNYNRSGTALVNRGVSAVDCTVAIDLEFMFIFLNFSQKI